MMFDPADWPEQAATLTLWRSPAASGGTVAAPARVTSLTGALMPASSFDGGRLRDAPEGLGGARYEMAFVYAGTAVRPGDELRRVSGGGTVRYKVQAVDVWTATASVSFVERVY